MRHQFVAWFVTFAFPALAFAQDGQALYRAHCASCHDASAQTRAPSRQALQQLTPERILNALESQSRAMLVQGLARTSAERRALALYLSGKTFGAEKPPDLSQAMCKQIAPFNQPLSGRSWNGWSPSPSNARFQNATAGGIDASRVPQL